MFALKFKCFFFYYRLTLTRIQSYLRQLARSFLAITFDSYLLLKPILHSFKLRAKTMKNFRYVTYRR